MKMMWKNSLLICLIYMFLACASVNAAARGYLTAKEQILYDTCQELIIAVAEGEKDETSFSISLTGSSRQIMFSSTDLGVSAICINSLSGKKYVSSVAAVALEHKMDQYSERILLALVGDCAGELYWFDQSKGLDLDYEYQISTISGEDALIITKVSGRLAINEDYTSDTAGIINRSKVSQAKKSLATANGIIAQAQGMPDREKLSFYKDSILRLASYDEYPKNSGNAYEMISVFDQDPNTKTVCEGYAKAFQYLCSKSIFSTDVECLYVMGMVKNEEENGLFSHAWNVIRMGESSCLVDLTNCEDDACGEPDYLYLAGYLSGSVRQGYRIPLPEGDAILYQYDQAIIELYGEQRLELSAHTHQKQTKKKVITAPTVDHTGSSKTITFCSTCGKTVSSVKVTEKKLKPTGKWKYSTLRMKKGSQIRKVLFINMANGDYVKSITSSNSKLLKVSSTRRGKVRFIAAKKTGVVYVTIRLHSGLKRKMKVTIVRK